MKHVIPVRSALAVSVALLLPSLAQAHPGNALVYNCASGILHPLHGIDHLAAMIAVGVWAAQLGGRARWLMPSAFVSIMTLGSVLGANGFGLPGLEPMIAASVLALGLLIVAAVRLPVAAGAGIVAIFAVLHGLAHGAELPAGANALSYGAGFIVATAALHAVGLALGSVGQTRVPVFSRGLGAACATAGFALLLS